MWPFRRKRLPPKLLLLGGTEEARHLAEALTAMGTDVVTSLAGRTPQPDLPGAVRVGGFGGVAGLTDTLKEGAFTVLVDATHPFAASISPAARTAARAARIPYFRLERRPWRPTPADRWTSVPDLDAAADALPGGANVFLAVGAGGLAPFLAREDLTLTVRTITEPDLAGRTDVTVITARGPFHLDDERALLARGNFDAMVTKNAGGEATAAKLLAARERRLLVVMVERPRGQPRPNARSVEDMLKRLSRWL